MIHINSVARTTLRRTLLMIASVTLAGCKVADATGTLPFAECADQPGCQSETAPLAPNVIDALNDATSRVGAALSPAARSNIAEPMAKLEEALVARDIVQGRQALQRVLDAVASAERADSTARADLGVIRLGLAPAARSLGLPFSAVEAPAN